MDKESKICTYGMYFVLQLVCLDVLWKIKSYNDSHVAKQKQLHIVLYVRNYIINIFYLYNMAHVFYYKGIFNAFFVSEKIWEFWNFILKSFLHNAVSCNFARFYTK